MSSTFKKALAAGAALALGLGIAGLSATAASAANSLPNSVDPFYLYSLDTGEVVADNTPLTYNSGVVAAPSSTDPDQLFTAAPAGTTGVKMFIAPRGQEANMASWNSSYLTGFKPGTQQVTQAPVSLDKFPASSFAAVKTAGGQYSLGFAYTTNNGVTFTGLGSFAYVTLEPGTANWTHVNTVPVVAQTAADNSPGEIGVEASVAAPVDGAFSLAIPANAKATLGAPSWVDNKSTSTGALPTFAVTDERRVSQKGWDATTSVIDFTRSGGSETLAATNLRIAPKAVAAGSTSTGVVTAAAFNASNAAVPFASAPAGSGLGVTNLSADLTFAAPAGSVQGTYTSKVTVTVVSK